MQQSSILHLGFFGVEEDCCILSILPVVPPCTVFGMMSSLHPTSLTLGAHAQQGLQYFVPWSVCVSVCLSVISNLASRTITHPTRDTNGFSGKGYKCFVK